MYAVLGFAGLRITADTCSSLNVPQTLQDSPSYGIADRETMGIQLDTQEAGCTKRVVVPA